MSTCCCLDAPEAAPGRQRARRGAASDRLRVLCGLPRPGSVTTNDRHDGWARQGSHLRPLLESSHSLNASCANPAHAGQRGATVWVTPRYVRLEALIRPGDRPPDAGEALIRCEHLGPGEGIQVREVDPGGDGLDTRRTDARAANPSGCSPSFAVPSPTNDASTSLALSRPSHVRLRRWSPRRSLVPVRVTTERPATSL